MTSLDGVNDGGTLCEVIDGRLKTSGSASQQTVARTSQAIVTVNVGRLVAVESVAAMSRVRDSAKGINNVIERVDKIAFQTRVLAMGKRGVRAMPVAALVHKLRRRVAKSELCAD